MHGTMKTFAVIRTNMAKEISVLASDRESAISSLHAIQDRLELTEERCGAFQKQLTSARGELANTNRTLAEVSNVHSAMNPLIKAPSKPPPLHNIAVRELTDATIAEQQELRRRAEERLGEKKVRSRTLLVLRSKTLTRRRTGARGTKEGENALCGERARIGSR